MQKRGLWAICFMVLGVLAAGTSLRAQGGDEGKAPLYIYVSQWAVPRAQWPDMAKSDVEHRAVEDKLLADGTIMGYGESVNLIHTEGQPTHTGWITASSEENILKALEAFRAEPDTTSSVLAASKHWDHFMVSRMYNSRPGNYEGGYASGSQWEVKPGQGRAFQNLLKTRVVPVLEKLLADGVLAAYSVDYQDYHTAAPGQVTVVAMTTDASGLDKMDAAFEATFAKDPEIGPAMGSLTEPGSHRDFLGRLTHMKFK